MRYLDPEPLAARAQALEAKNLNGFKLVFVELIPAPSPTHAFLTVEFYNSIALTAIGEAIYCGATIADIFTLSGGSRVNAGEGPAELKIVDIEARPNDTTLKLKTSGIGDYSTYTLHVSFNKLSAASFFDPFFASIPFKFRPGCFNLNCAPEFDKGKPLASQPIVDYLARDFDSIKHVLINAMRERVPHWQPTSEADLDMVVLDLLAGDTDELCDFQDRVMQEAYLGLARKRVSLARHARLMDYHIHQGNQAGTWLVAKVSSNDLEPPLANTEALLPTGTGVWTGPAWDEPNAVIFVTQADQCCFEALNQLGLYTWDSVVTALEAGATEAEIAIPSTIGSPTQTNAETLCNLLRREDVRYLVLEEKINPETGRINGRDIGKRQLLRLLEGEDAAEIGYDPFDNFYFVRVRWQESDRLKQRYCFVIRCPDQSSNEDVCAFHGNVVYATHGRPHRVIFHPLGTEPGLSDGRSFLRHDETWWEASPWGTVAPLPHSPLAYLDSPPGGESAPFTTAVVRVSGFEKPWIEHIDLIQSEGDDSHYMVETDELGCSRLRFGTGRNGMRLDSDTTVTCDYQVGQGSLGNVGADTLTGFDRTALPHLIALHNPFTAKNGREPEPRREIIRRAPEAYRRRQLRAVTLADYVQRAEQLPDVSHAHARYAWTGSWRTVRISIDPRGTTTLDDVTRCRVERHLDVVRLIGEDLEIRPARYVPLDIKLRLCAHPDYWPEDLDIELQREFSDGFTADGRMGFFNPDVWTFGQPLHASQIVGRAMSIRGVERVLLLSMRRWAAGTGYSTSAITLKPEELPDAPVDRINVEAFEIIQVTNDPNHMEFGRILFEIDGGRR